MKEEKCTLIEENVTLKQKIQVLTENKVSPVN